MEPIGERKIIELILEQLERMPNMPIPFGDDVSAYPLRDDKLLILKTDMLVGKTDAPAGMSLWQAARKAVIMNVSDFAAKGVEPNVLLVSIGLPKELKKDDIKEIARGLNAGAREYGVYVVGGDTNEASDIVVSVSLFGIAKKGMVMLRSGAKQGDIVAVTGFFGKTAAGLKILLENFKAPKKLRNNLVNSVFMPYARLKEGLALNRTRAVTASIDSSDGLAWSLYEIAMASNVGFMINKVPTANEVERFAKINRLDPLELTFYGGEEYELVVTVRPDLWEKAEKAVRKVGGKLLPIGRATTDKQVLLKINDKTYEIEPRGWEHFK